MRPSLSTRRRAPAGYSLRPQAARIKQVFDAQLFLDSTGLGRIVGKFRARDRIFSQNDQNNAVIASMMVPGTKFGVTQPSLYKNIYVEDAPQVLFSLKILPPDCDLTSFDAGCPVLVDLTQSSMLNLKIENVFTPRSIEQNSIGFETLNGYTNPVGMSLPPIYTLMGNMNISLTNVFVAGKIVTSGDNVNVEYKADKRNCPIYGYGVWRDDGPSATERDVLNWDCVDNREDPNSHR